MLKFNCLLSSYLIFNQNYHYDYDGGKQEYHWARERLNIFTTRATATSNTTATITTHSLSDPTVERK